MAAKQTLGDRIARARLAFGATRGRFVSQADLAAMVGLTGATMGNYEAGRTEPSYATLEAIAKVLGVSPGALAFGEGDRTDAGQYRPTDELPKYEASPKKRRRRAQ